MGLSILGKVGLRSMFVRQFLLLQTLKQVFSNGLEALKMRSLQHHQRQHSTVKYMS